MDLIKWIWGYLTGPLTQMTEKATKIPMRVPGGVHAKLAGVLGATAVAALAYSAHGFQDSERFGERYKSFKNGADINILHSLALLGVQVSRFPKLTTSLFLVGTVLFSGTCYYTALANDRRFVRIAPIGGTTLILAWLTFAL